MNTLTPYDSTKDTVEHISNVRSKILKVVADLIERGFKHDASKLEQPEKEILDKYKPQLKLIEFGSNAEKEIIKKMKVGLDHHYSHNRHHPQFFADGVDGMNLIDLLEMILDWKSACETASTKNADIFKSIEICAERFKIEPQLKQILLNTATYLWYE
jgi:hypothetical protein